MTIYINADYEHLIKRQFPNAQIIIDRFHLVQLINRSMNKSRIHIMNAFNRGANEEKKKYRRLKKYWHLPLKNERDLTYTNNKYFPLFGQTTYATVVETLLNYDEQLKVNYKLYQILLNVLKEKDFNQLTKVLEPPLVEGISTDFKRSVNTLKSHLSSIQNSFIYPFG